MGENERKRFWAKMRERDFQKWAIGQWRGCGQLCDNIHPTAGMAFGIPDTWFLVKGDFVFVEMKFGQIQKCGTKMKLKHDIRGSQRAWHRKLWQAGGKSCLLVGVDNGDGWDVYLMKQERVLLHPVPQKAMVGVDDVIMMSLKAALLITKQKTKAAGLVSEKKGN